MMQTGSNPENPFDLATATIESDQRVDALADRLAAPATALAGSAAGPVLLGQWLGHALHPMMTDLPIGCWTSAALVDVVGGRDGRKVAQRLVGLGVLAAIPTALTGLTEYSTIDGDDEPDRRVAAVHAACNAGATLSYLRSWQVRRRGRHARGIAWSVVGAGLASVSGHLGGHLAFVGGIGSGSRSNADASAGTGGAYLEGPEIDAMPPTSDRSTAASPSPEPSSVVGTAAAAEVLGMTEDSIHTLVDQGMLTPSDGDPPTFLLADLEAVRIQGG